jgi:hypothetical protein
MFKMEPKSLCQLLKDPQLNVKLEWGARRLVGENLKVSSYQVFNFKFGCFVMSAIEWGRQARPHYGLKTQPRFCPVNLSLSKLTSLLNRPKRLEEILMGLCQPT